MNWLNKLPGFTRSPYGFELRTLKMLPNVLLAGTALPAFAAWLGRLYFADENLVALEKRIQTFDFTMIGVAVFVWTAVLTVGIYCIIVWLMKGPAYVADGYEVSHSDKPKN
jgi:nitrate reductase NapE component